MEGNAGSSSCPRSTPLRIALTKGVNHWMRLPVLALKIGIDNKSTKSKMPKHEPAPYLPALQAVNRIPCQIEIFLNRSNRALFVNFEIRKLPAVLLQQFLQTQ